MYTFLVKGFRTVSSSTCDQATLTIEILFVNDPPILVDDSFIGNEDVTISGNVFSNDIEYDERFKKIDGITLNKTNKDQTKNNVSKDSVLSNDIKYDERFNS